MKKIPTVFERDPETNLKHVKNEVHPGCEWVLAGEGVPTRKYDGTCVQVFHTWYDGPQVGVKARRVVKAGKTAPASFEAVETDPATGHSVGWEPYAHSGFAKYIEEVVGDDPQVDDWPEGTYELCGPKINGNPEGYERHVMVRHLDAQEIPLAAGLTFDNLRERLTTDWPHEGIVWHHPDGRMAKLKKRDFA